MQDKILLYGKPHVVKLPPGYREKSQQERDDYLDDCCIGLDFKRDNFLELETDKDVTELEKLYGKAK